jgi:hypothetical protein
VEQQGRAGLRSQNIWHWSKEAPATNRGQTPKSVLKHVGAVWRPELAKLDNPVEKGGLWPVDSEMKQLEVFQEGEDLIRLH